MKKEIDFPADFASNEAMPLHMGRLYLGKQAEFVCRLYFKSDGSFCIAVPQEAVDAGAVVVHEVPLDDIGLLGFTGNTSKG